VALGTADGRAGAEDARLESRIFGAGVVIVVRGGIVATPPTESAR
jgi:hypothetical protein